MSEWHSNDYGMKPETNGRLIDIMFRDELIIEKVYADDYNWKSCYFEDAEITMWRYHQHPILEPYF